MKKINSRKIILMLVDMAIMVVTYAVLAWMVLYESGSVLLNGELTIWKLVGFILVIEVVRVIIGLYNSVWRYADVESFLKLTIGDLIAGGCYFILGRFIVPSLSLGFAYTIIFLFVELMLTLMSRFAYQIAYAELSNRRHVKGSGTKSNNLINVAIIGASNVGVSLAAEMTRNRVYNYNPYCFIDTDHEKIGNRINGIEVIEETDDIVDIIRDLPVQEIVIALPGLSPEAVAKLYEMYKKTGCKVKIYDQPANGWGGKGAPSMREIRIEDLLFRETIDATEDSPSRDFYAGKKVLVTGGGGSIGSELCRQIASLHPKRLVIVDIYENNAYEIQQELIRNYGVNLNLDVVIASVRDEKRLDEIFDRERPDIVFHAAAHKHVPLMEHSGCEAIKNNVLGTYNVANMAEKYGVKKFLLISTDKAVNPTNIMGASKRLCEMVIQCRTESKTEFVAVRFGNVLGSNGSVIPLFKKQIAEGGPITLTDKRIIRYFMTISEAVSLVMETCAMAKGGELYVLDMGNPVKILDLAEKMIELSGLVPYEDIDIKEVGLRPGEKLYEELLMKSETLGQTANKKIFIEKDEPLSRQEVEDKLTLLRNEACDDDYDAVRNAIRACVPTYHDPSEINDKVKA